MSPPQRYGTKGTKLKAQAPNRREVRNKKKKIKHEPDGTKDTLPIFLRTFVRCLRAPFLMGFELKDNTSFLGRAVDSLSGNLSKYLRKGSSI